MPPRDSSIPQPWPAVSPDHRNEIERRSLGAVRKRPTIGSPTISGGERAWKRAREKTACPAGRPPVKGLAGKAGLGGGTEKSAGGQCLKLSVVAISTSMRAGRSARAQTMPESTETSPD